VSNFNLSCINSRINLLESICPEAITLPQNKQFTLDLTLLLSNLKAAREGEAGVLMIAGNTIAASHAVTVLNASPSEQRTDVKPAEWKNKIPPIEQIRSWRKK